MNHEAIQKALLSWYQTSCRDLPWRAKPDAKGKKPSKLKDANPYDVLVSEAMLQQTQVATVVDYFRRFIEAFPTIEALAESSESDVMHLWQGLGYYRRARHLHQAAKYVVDELGGAIPSTAKELKALPGVGPYTAGAIASIAFGEQAPLVDGNVIRVLSRLALLEVAANDAGQAVWDLAQDLLPEQDSSRAKRNPVGDFNQGLMELGATICHARDPKCLLCPLSQHCKAHEKVRVQDFPLPAERKAPKNAVHHVMVFTRQFRNQPQVYLMQRGEAGLWSGMWELPTVEYVLGKGGRLKRAADWPARAAKAQLEKGQDDERADFFLSHQQSAAYLDAFKHQTTHRSIDFILWQISLDAKVKREMKSTLAGGDWASFNGAKERPMSNPQRKVLDLLVELGLL